MNFPTLLLKATIIFHILIATYLIPIECSRINPSGGQDFVTKICRKTPYFDLCMTILFPDERSYATDTKGLAKIVMEKDLSVAKEIQAQAQSLARDSRKPRDLRAKCGKCAEEYKEIVSDLIPGARKFVDLKRYGASIQKLQNAAMKAKACDEQFKGDGTSPIVNMSVHDMSLIAVAIIKAI